MPDEMPGQRQVAEFFKLGQGLLKPILSNVDDTCFCGLSDPIGWNGLGNGNQLNRFSCAAASFGRCLDLVEDSAVVLPNINHWRLRCSGGPRSASAIARSLKKQTADTAYLTFFVRELFGERPLPAATVCSSTAGERDALAFLLSLRLCFRISMRSTTFAGPGPFAAGTWGETPATFIWIISSTLSWYSSLYLVGSNFSDMESMSVFARSISFLEISAFLGRFSVPGSTTSCAKRMVCSVIRSPTLLTAARCSRDLRTTLAIPTLFDCANASRMSA